MSEQKPQCGHLGATVVGPVTCQLEAGHAGEHKAWQYAETRTGDVQTWGDPSPHSERLMALLDEAYQWPEARIGWLTEAITEARGIEEQLGTIRQIVLRGWSDHMWNFEMMAEDDEAWLLTWAGHPSAEAARENAPGVSNPASSPSDEITGDGSGHTLPPIIEVGEQIERSDTPDPAKEPT